MEKPVLGGVVREAELPVELRADHRARTGSAADFDHIGAGAFPETGRLQGFGEDCVEDVVQCFRLVHAEQDRLLGAEERAEALPRAALSR